MARVTRPRQKMANTTDSPTTAGGSLLSSSTTTPFPTSSTSAATYSSEGYTFNYSGLPNLGGYSLDDFNYTELWLDVWNGTEVSNVTERLNATVLLPPGGYCDEWEAAQHKLFQVKKRFKEILEFFKIYKVLLLRNVNNNQCFQHISFLTLRLNTFFDIFPLNTWVFMRRRYFHHFKVI